MMVSKLIAQHNNPAETMPARRQSPAPISILAGGSAGENLTLGFIIQMCIAGRAGRLQCNLIVNYNQAEIDRTYELLKSYRGAHRLLTILPSHVHEGEGWGGDPTAWKDSEGLILLDQQEMAQQAKEHSGKIGSQPGIIPMFASLGGGHAEVALKAFEAVHQTYPESTVLPIIIIPNNPTQYGFIREYTYEKYDQTLAGRWALIVDNAAMSQDTLNDLVTLGLTSLDTCGSSILTPGSLRQAVLSLRHFITHSQPGGSTADGREQEEQRTGFLRMAVVRTPLRSKKAWRLGFPLRQLKLVQTRGNQVDFAVRSAIKEALENPAALLDTNPLPTPGVPQVVAVTLPVKRHELSKIVRSVKAILGKEEWYHPHAVSTNLLFGSVNFTDPVALTVDEPEQDIGLVTRVLRGCFSLATAIPRLGHRLVFGKNHQQKELYVTVTRLFPELGPMHRLEAILHPTARVTDGVSQTGYGFGTRQHVLTTQPQQNSHPDKDPVLR
jgi:hypothetical protein